MVSVGKLIQEKPVHDGRQNDHEDRVLDHEKHLSASVHITDRSQHGVGDRDPDECDQNEEEYRQETVSDERQRDLLPPCHFFLFLGERFGLPRGGCF